VELQKTKILLFIIISIALIYSCYNYNTQDLNRLDPYASAKIDSLMQTFMEIENLSGFAVGVVRNNDIIYTKSFGVKNIETKRPVTPLSIFYVASVSKPFTATAILQLVEQGKISLDSTIVHYLPYFKLADKRYKSITIRQISNHTAGFPGIENFEYENPQYDESAAERYTRSLTNIYLLSNPGEQISYTDMGYNILADIIQKVTDVSFEDYMQKNILKPLNMNLSTFLKSEINTKYATSPHVLKEEENNRFLSVSDIYPYNRIHAPCGTLHSNVMDMCKWLIACLNGGEYKGNWILESSSLELMIKEKLGLDWWRGEKYANTFVNHGGADIGYRSFICFIPEISLGVVALVNSDNLNANRIGYQTLWLLEEIKKKSN
jgi:CubicO group peptidase (beta-lactamase class C family)